MPDLLPDDCPVQRYYLRQGALHPRADGEWVRWDDVANIMQALEGGIAAVSSLIAQSSGVEGLHHNGDIATWEDLLAGGQYEDWLRAFSEAEAAIEGDSEAAEAARKEE